MVHVVTVVDGVVSGINSFEEKDVKKAESLFKEFAREQIDENLTEGDFDDFLMDGYVEAESHNLSICITHNELEVK